MITLTYPLTECQKCTRDKIIKPKPNCDVCNGYGYLIRKSNGFTTQILPKEGEMWKELGKLSHFGKVKKVEIESVVSKTTKNIAEAYKNLEMRAIITLQ